MIKAAAALLLLVAVEIAYMHWSHAGAFIKDTRTTFAIAFQALSLVAVCTALLHVVTAAARRLCALLADRGLRLDFIGTGESIFYVVFCLAMLHLPNGYDGPWWHSAVAVLPGAAHYLLFRNWKRAVEGRPLCNLYSLFAIALNMSLVVEQKTRFLRLGFSLDSRREALRTKATFAAFVLTATGLALFARRNAFFAGGWWRHIRAVLAFAALLLVYQLNATKYVDNYFLFHNRMLLSTVLFAWIVVEQVRWPELGQHQRRPAALALAFVAAAALGWTLVQPVHTSGFVTVHAPG